MLAERSEAIDLLRELVSAEVELVKQLNTRGLTKKAVARETRAVRAIFKALVGDLPVDEEVQAIISC